MAAASLGAADASHAANPLWDGKESVAQYARRVNLPETQTLDLGNAVSLELVLIPAGRFIMGTPEPKPVDEEAFHKKIVTGQAVLAVGGGILLVLIGFAILRAIRERRRFQYSLRRLIAMTFAAGLCVLGGMHWWHSGRKLAQAQAEYSAAFARYNDAGDYEKPAHEVTITKPFYMGKYKVTQEQYAQVMGTNPSRFRGPRLPVETVSWDDAQEFCKKVSEKTGQTVRLPTEAGWEFACRAGTTTVYYTGDTEADLGRAAWYGVNSKGTTHPVGQKEPNAWGLYDMHGNVWEWCQDWYKKYEGGAAADPTGPATGTYRVVRGGVWLFSPGYCRSAARYGRAPVQRDYTGGFGVVLAGPL